MNRHSAIDREDWLYPLYAIMCGGLFMLVTPRGQALFWLCVWGYVWFYFADKLDKMIADAELRNRDVSR